MKRYFQISLHALILTAFLALALTGRLDALSIVLFAACAGWSFHRTIRDLPPPLSAHGAFVLSCIYIGIFVFDTAIISRSFIPATIHLVLFLELVKLYQEKTDRDYFYMIVLSFLKILAASSLTIDMTFVITLVLFLVALVSTLMSFDMYRSERKAEYQAQAFAMPLGGISVWATAWILLTGIVLFFLIPRVGTGYFSRATNPSLLLSGFTENVDLGQIGNVKLSAALVMRAKLLSGRPESSVKWRGISLDAFNGKSWYKTRRAHRPIATATRGSFTIAPMDNSGNQVRYQILLEPLATTALFAPHRVRFVKGTFPDLEVDSDEAIYTRLPALRRIQYEVLSEIPSVPRILAAANRDEVIPPEIRDRYLQLPTDLDPGVRDLGSQITARAVTTSDKAAAVEQYLKANYRYTLELTWTPGDQPVSMFLLKAKEGYCEHFATGMAILLRAVGVPTRIVNGFLMGEYNPVDSSYIIRQSDAHSWVEVYVPGSGWIEYDPTPPDPRQRPTGLLAQLSHYVDAAELYWNSYILIYDSGLQFQLFRSAQDRAQTLQADVRTSSDRWLTESEIISDRIAGWIQRRFDSPVFWVLIGLSGASAVGIRYRRLIRTQIAIWQLRKGVGAMNDDVVEQLFYRAAKLAERTGAGRKPAETWREWIRALPDPGKQSRLGRALEVYERSRYGRLPLSSADFTLLEETIRALKS